MNFFKMFLNNYRRNYRRNIITEGYTDEMKRINLVFYYQRIYRRKIHRRSIFVGDSVGKLITDGYVSYTDGKIPSVKLLNLVVLA